jgi:hypothetical protein
MMHTNIPQAIAHAWASKVDEVLSSEGMFKDVCHSSSSLLEWRLPFYECKPGARLALSAQHVAGRPLTVTLSWQIRVFNPDAANAAGHCHASRPLGTCDIAELPALVSSVLDTTTPSALASWILSTYAREPARTL